MFPIYDKFYVSYLNMDNFENSCEPMDVDLSINSINAMEISYPDNVMEQPLTNNSNVDNENINICPVKQHNPGKSFILNRNLIILSITVCALSFLAYNIISITCCENLNIVTLKTTLHSKIYGQTQAIDNIISFLELKENVKLLILYGSTGVGKTLTVSLLFEDILNYTNVYYYTMSNIKNGFAYESMLGFTFCKSSFVVIDDISINDKNINVYIDELMKKSVDLGKNITILLLYNCINTSQQLSSNCPYNFLTTLELLFSDITTAKRIVKFESLTEDSLKKCIQHEFGPDTIIDDSKLLKLMKSFNVQRDGCKGVHQKSKYFNVL